MRIWAFLTSYVEPAGVPSKYFTSRHLNMAQESHPAEPPYACIHAIFRDI